MEFDVFEGKFAGLMLAEIEFTCEEDAREFPPLSWFDRDVTWSGEIPEQQALKNALNCSYFLYDREFPVT